MKNDSIHNPLKPCPFCGKAGVVEKTPNGYYWQPRCIDWCVQMDSEDTKAQAAKKWNRRATSG